MMPCFAALPDDLLAAVFSRVNCMPTRHRTIPAVCRRWRRVATSAKMLGLVVADMDANDPASFMARLRSLAEWLSLRAAPHVHTLSLCVYGHDRLHQHEQEEATALIVGALVACGAGGQLRDLLLGNYRSVSLALSTWLSACRGLQRLSLRCDEGETPFIITASLECLTALHTLETSEGTVQLGPAAALPPSLTKLVFTPAEECLEMPPQWAALTNLRHLSLKYVFYTSASYAPLLRLASLRHLHLSWNSAVPACLPSLTWLEELSLERSWRGAPDSGDIVRHALPRLASLSGLVLTSMPGLDSLPPELSALTSLRCVSWLSERDAAAAVLPSGPWLAHLQQLECPAPVLARSLPQLSAAAQLTRLTLGFADKAPAASASVLIWAASSSTLPHMLIDSSAMPPTLSDAALQAQRCRPSLVICTKIGG